MRPIDLAQLEYDGNSPRTFVQDFAFFTKTGYLYAGEDCFIMAKPIERKRDYYIFDKEALFEHPDSWFVYLASGDNPLHRFLALAPFKTKWVCWHRRTDNQLRYYLWETYERKVKKWEAQT